MDRLYKNYGQKIISEGYQNLVTLGWPSTQEEFINKLLFDDDFYQRWGEDCCEELTYIERYGLWFTINYETGMEYNTKIEPDWDNDYYEPTPKRKFR